MRFQSFYLQIYLQKLFQYHCKLVRNFVHCHSLSHNSQNDPQWPVSIFSSTGVLWKQAVKNGNHLTASVNSFSAGVPWNSLLKKSVSFHSFNQLKFWRHPWNKLLKILTTSVCPSSESSKNFQKLYKQSLRTVRMMSSMYIPSDTHMHTHMHIHTQLCMHKHNTFVHVL